MSNIFRIGKATLSSALLKLFAQKYIDKPKGDRQIILAAENFFLGSVQPPHSARISQSKWMLSVANLVIYCNDFGKFLHDPVQTRETI